MAPAESQVPKRYVCLKAPTSLQIDGDVHKPIWNSAPWTDLFVDIEGDAKPMPRFETRAKMLWDDHYFYVAAELKEPDVWATLTEHDSVIFHDNDFEVFIDPDGDSARYFEFEINALNTTWDLYLPKAYRDGGSADNSWETYAKSAVKVQGTLNNPTDTDEGWTVEIAFPWECFKQNAGMPCPPNPGDVWRVNFSRVEWHTDIVEGRYVKRKGLKEDNWVWSPQGVIDMHQPEQWGFVEFA
ncbi:MAG: hypothetical protein BGO01_10310 [Armatimonadetes bacterium 55-13]|nr:carbohydrate-binding family 9-like protein [Armatimonadota bacterium]OJU62790.1 MAG: hypothetical protein BGO01_10310 [Armatimonadetes bacterium 55-13]